MKQKAFVITIMDLPESVKAAERCIKSAKDKSNLHVEMFPAFTPKSDPVKILQKYGISCDLFNHDIGSRRINVLAAFASHHELWQHCSKERGNIEYVIFEHDAVVVSEIPIWPPYQGCMNLGAPSYGKWKQPPQFGVNPLTSKPYFPGAHAYKMKPNGAKAICEVAQYNAEPTDVFLNRTNFPWIEEFFPWPVIAKDSFTTIQNPTGCQAKHNYKKGGYEIVKVD